MDLMPPARSRDDWVKKAILSFMVLLFMFGITMGIIGVMTNNGMLAGLDPLTSSVVSLIPVVLSIGIIYGIFKADFIN